MSESIRILFVCMGNICRSPMAEGVFRALVAEAGLAERVTIDSAGTIDYHAGEAPDPRAVATAAARGVTIDGLRARRVTPEDCGHFDLVLAMDRGNLNRLRRSCGQGDGGAAAGDPPDATGKAEVRLFLEFAPGRREQEVPDPYSGGREGFEYVLDLIEEGAQGLLAEVRRRLDRAPA